MTIITAPFTADQIKALNVYQTLGFTHQQYTCGRRTYSCEGILVAEASGWRCAVPGCDYTQNWAHVLTADLSQHPKHPFPNHGKK
mgnify:FL=1